MSDRGRLRNRRLIASVYILITFILIACQQNPLPDAPQLEDAPAGSVEVALDWPPALRAYFADDLQAVDRWRRLDTTGGGQQTSIAVHPTDAAIVYMASDNGGLFKTDNAGLTWYAVSSNLGAYRLGFVTLDPLDPNVIYVTAKTDSGRFEQGGATGEIQRSRNAGLSWEFVSDAMGFQSSVPNQTSIVIPSNAANPQRYDRDGDRLSDVMLVGAWSGDADPPVGGIWLSEDEGGSFAQVALHDRNVTAVRAFIADHTLLYAATFEGEVFRSDDLGRTWVEVTSNLPLRYVSDLAIHPTDGETVYVTCRQCTPGEPAVWKTVDGGQRWQAVSKDLDTNKIDGFPRILMDRFDPQTLYVTSDGGPLGQAGVYKSTDGAQSWQVMPFSLALPDGRPYSWYQLEGKFAIGQAIDGTLYAGDTGAWRYPDGDPNDGVQQWEPATLGIGNVHVNVIEVDPFDARVLYQGISDLGPYKSVDHGRSFHRILGAGWPVTLDNYSWSGPYYRNYRDCQEVCPASCETEGRFSSGGATDFALSRQHRGVVYSAFGGTSGTSLYGGVNKSTDGGRTWQPVGFQVADGFELNPETCVPYGFRHLAIDPTNDQIVFAAMEIPQTNEGRLYRTLDGGAKWSIVLSTTDFITGVDVSAADPRQVVAATSNEVYRSENGGDAQSWQVITPPEATGIRTLRVSPHAAHTFAVGANSKGLYYTEDAGVTWSRYPLRDLFEQKLYQGSAEVLNPNIRTAYNPSEQMLSNVSAIVFDPLEMGVLYIGGTQYGRASFGVAKFTARDQTWERLALEGLSSRNIFDLAIDSAGEFLYAGTFDGTYRLKLKRDAG